MKIVVNRCYGGFGLSPLATKRYLELSGFQCYFYTQTKYKHDGGKDEYVQVDVDQAEKEIGVVHVYKKDLGKRFSKWPEKMPDYFGHYNLERNDPMLVKAVEELGEKANGQFAKLEVVEIPDGIEWHLDEYDGIESIHENHRSW
jgi:hypothetical protein